MGIINLLPSDLANQIAAGEVVERPASVAKELIENAIDAGARRIQVHIELGGKRLVRVEDDGEGMRPEDARLSLERHATSKIQRAEDLAAINTLGFRGEALPSIASVSHFVMKSRFRGELAGTEIKVNGGAVASVQEVGIPEGTSIEVGDLFYNLPARRKFLKTDTGEATQVSRVVTQFALGYPEIGFSVTSGPRTMFNWPAVAKFEDRLYQVFGERPDLVPVGKSLSGCSIKGFVAALVEQGPTRGSQNVFVNRRIVKDKTIAHAIIEAYSNASIKERSPEVHLFLEIPGRSHRRQRAPDEGRSALPGSVVHPRSREARDRRRHRKGRGAGTAAAPGELSRSGARGAVDSRGIGRRYLSEQMGPGRSVGCDRCVRCAGCERCVGCGTEHRVPSAGNR